MSSSEDWKYKEEQKPMNNGERLGGDLSPAAPETVTVALGGPPASGPGKRRLTSPLSGRCSRTQVLLLVLIAASVLTILSIAAVILTRTPCHHHHPVVSDPKESSSLPLAVNSTVDGGTTKGPGRGGPSPGILLRWNEIRLPRSVVPSFYRLKLRVDMDQFLFFGSVEIYVDVVSDTDFIVLHVNSLSIDPENVLLLLQEERKEEEDDEWEDEQESLKRTTASPNHDLFILETHEVLRRGSKRRIVISNFNGTINDDLRGLYRSVYKDHAGKLK